MEDEIKAQSTFKFLLKCFIVLLFFSSWAIFGVTLALQGIEVSVNGTVYYNTDGSIVQDESSYPFLQFTYKTDNTASVCAKNKDIEGDIVVPSCVLKNRVFYRVNEVDNYAFRDCAKITSLTLPESIEIIGARMCCFCYTLTTVNLPSHVTSIDTSYMFTSSAVTSVTLPVGTTAISNSAFLECKSLLNLTLPEGITEIGFKAFTGCISITKISLPTTITSCPNTTLLFSDCESLETIENFPQFITEIGESMFSVCKKLYSVNLPKNITKINGRAFNFCYALPSIDLTNVTSIGEYAFNYCSTLSSIGNLHANVSIGNRAFSRCSALTSVQIPSTATVLDSTQLFYNCTALESVSLPDSLTSIGEQMFYACPNLKSITIGERVTHIGANAFYYCQSLTSANFVNKQNWSADSQPITPESLQDAQTSATYLRSTYVACVWTRS